MDINNYISTGILEMYIAGSLSEKENQEIYDLSSKHPEILSEIKHIEKVIIELTAAANPFNTDNILNLIKNKLNLSNC